MSVVLFSKSGQYKAKCYNYRKKVVVIEAIDEKLRTTAEVNEQTAEFKTLKSFKIKKCSEVKTL